MPKFMFNNFCYPRMDFLNSTINDALPLVIRKIIKSHNCLINPVAEVNEVVTTWAAYESAACLLQFGDSTYYVWWEESQFLQ